MATHEILPMYRYASPTDGNPATVRVQMGAGTQGFSIGTLIRCSTTAGCAIKAVARENKLLIGMAEWKAATQTSIARGTLKPVTVIRPGDLYVGTITGAAVAHPGVFRTAASNRTDTTNGNYYATVNVTVSTTAGVSVCNCLGFVNNQGAFTTGAWWGARSTSADSAGSTVRGSNYPNYASGDTNPRVIFTWIGNAFYL